MGQRFVRVLILAGIVVAAIFATFVWPTRHRYDTLKLGKREVVMRTDRFTGAVERMTWNGWEPADDGASADDKHLSKSDLERLTGTAGITNHGWIEANIYNGTSHRLRAITIVVVIKDNSDKVKVTRMYRLTTTYGSPLGSDKYFANAGFDLAPTDDFSWSLVSAERIE